jgi:biopolymer transport protein ExbD
MERVKKRCHRRREQAELNVTAFMNLMIVLVPVLLLSLVFTHTSVIDLDFPAGDSPATELDADLVHLEVVVHDDALVVGDGRGGTIKRLAMVDGQHDYESLGLTMREVKRRLPEKRDIAILLQRDTDYQTLVSIVDRVRSYRTVQALEVVNAELFPVISLGDAPVTGAATTVASRS